MWMDEEKDYHGEAIGEGDFSKYGHYSKSPSSRWDRECDDR